MAALGAFNSSSIPEAPARPARSRWIRFRFNVHPVTGRTKGPPVTLLSRLKVIAELATLVRTLPEAQQQMIEAAVDRLLKERDQ
jgi:hypothetical protein